MMETAGAAEQANARVGSVQAIAVVIALVPLIGAFLAIGSAFKVSDFLFAGFLFVLYWTGIKAMALDEFAPALLGSLGGLGLAFLTHSLPVLIGTAGHVVVALAVALSIYLLVRQMAGIVINNAFMLLLTIGNCLAFDSASDYAAAAGAIVLAALYTGGLVMLGRTIANLRARKPVASAAP